LLGNLCRKLRGNPLVSVYEVHPVVPELGESECELTLVREAKPWLLNYLGSDRSRNGHSVVGRARIDHYHLISPRDRGEAAADVRLFIASQYDDTDRDAARRRIVSHGIWLKAEFRHCRHPRIQLK
jgi:hypothetical protein